MYALAAGCAAGAIALGLIVLLRNLPGDRPQVQYLAPNSRLGRGPHVTIDCEPNEQLVGELVSMVEQLRDAATEEQWSVDWKQFDERTRQGKAAVDRRDFTTAVREYALALQFMMSELRNQRARKKASESPAQR